MDNLNLLCQTIRFQRTTLQRSLAMISAVQQHGERFLKTTLDQSPWIPGESKDACLFWAGIWRKNLTGMSELVDKNLATMERLTSTGARMEKKWKAEKPAAEPTEPPRPETIARKAQEKEQKQAPEKPQPAEKEVSPPKEAEQTAKAAIEAQKTQAAEAKKAQADEAHKAADEAHKAAAETKKAQAESHEKKPEQPPGKQPSEKKKPS